MNDEVVVIHLTETCDMVFKEEDEVYYFINGGENDGVGFTLLDFVVSLDDDGKVKHNYLPLIVTNPFNAPVQGIYTEIHEVVQAKVQLYMDTIK